MKNIALVPGVLGFEQLGGIINYFNGVAPYLNEKFAGQVHVEPFDTLPLVTVEERAAKLAEQITGIFRGEDVHIFAHSMGGLDARLLVARRETPVAARVKSITGIGTPHQGSPVATFLNAFNPLDGLARIAELIGHEDSLDPIFMEFKANTNALHDLSTDTAATFNERYPDRLQREGDFPKVAYHEVVGLSRPGLPQTSLVFELPSVFCVFCTENVLRTTVSFRSSRQRARAVSQSIAGRSIMPRWLVTISIGARLGNLTLTTWAPIGGWLRKWCCVRRRRRKTVAAAFKRGNVDALRISACVFSHG